MYILVFMSSMKQELGDRPTFKLYLFVFVFLQHISKCNPNIGRGLL